MYLQTALLILVMILIVLVIICIPVLIQIWRVTRNLEITLLSMNQSFPVILKNVEEITANINNSTATVNQKIQNFANASNKSGLVVGDIMNNIQLLTPLIMKLPIFRIIRNVVAVAKGVQVFVDVLLKKEKA